MPTRQPSVPGPAAPPSPQDNRPQGFANALQVFQRAAQEVPAYKDFLAKNGVDPSAVHAPADFQAVPPVTKANYLKQYPLTDLLWGGTWDQARMVSMSSGSSGQPFYWLRGNQNLEDSIVLHDRLFSAAFATRDRQTLCIIAFSMGTWIAGTYTLHALFGLADRGHKVTCITPGINKRDILRILKELAPQFEQTVLCGYPPFIKDTLDEAEGMGLDLPSLNLRLLFAGENFSERWRRYVHEKIGAANDPFRSASVYGTADAGMLGNETPFSVTIRQALAEDEALRETVFPGMGVLPTLVHYDPQLRYFEELDGTLAFTVAGALPLVRYNILDRGRVVQADALLEAATGAGHHIPEALEPFRKFPLVALFGRDDVSTTFYALNIYPENIRYGLEQLELQPYVTGKFVAKTELDDATQRQSLHIHLELKPGLKATTKLRTLLARTIIASLRQYNSEYNKLYHEIEKDAAPHLHLAAYESGAFTPGGVKHRWTA